MTEPEATNRLASRLENLRKLGDRNRAQHPVSVLRNDIVAQDALEPGLPDDSELDAPSPSVEERTYVLARRLFSPLIARAEVVAEEVRQELAGGRVLHGPPR